MKRLSMIMALFAFAAIFFAGCQQDISKGTLKLSITDAPIDSDNITGVFITIIDIQYQLNGNNYVSLEGFEGPKVVNLLELTRGVTELLGIFELESGKYTGIRFMLDAPVKNSGSKSNPGCYLVFKNGATQPLFVPSGAQSGFKAVGEFTVPSDGVVEITADFDVRKSIVKAGASGKYILKPTIRLVADNQVGKIAGNVIFIPENTQIVVYAYEAGKYTSAEADEPAAETSRFPNAISSDKVDESGNYQIDFLAPKAYDLVIVTIVDGIFSRVLGIVENVVVDSKMTTTKNIDIRSL
jgi:hypothetical protein